MFTPSSLSTGDALHTAEEREQKEDCSREGRARRPAVDLGSMFHVELEAGADFDFFEKGLPPPLV